MILRITDSKVSISGGPPRTVPERDADPTRGLAPPPQRTPETDEGKQLTAARKAGVGSIFQGPLVRRAIVDSFWKLDPRVLARNPVMFVVEVGAVITTIVLVAQIISRTGHIGFTFQITVWLWFTVLFANFAEAMAEARGKAQADTLRATKRDTPARRVHDGKEEIVSSSVLRKGDHVLVNEGEIIPGDGEVLEGLAYVNDAAITGESAPVLKEPGTDIRSSVTGGTQIVSDHLLISITADPGQTFLDRMIALVEGAVRQKTPNEIALSILLAGLSIIYLLTVTTLQPFAIYAGSPISTVILNSLLVCLVPTTIGGLLSAIGIAGMDRVTRFNLLALSGRAVEAAGDVDTLLLDKTGTITYGNRLAAEILPVGDAHQLDALIVAQRASFGDETPEGRSILALAEQLGAPPTDGVVANAEVVPFKAETRMSGLVVDSDRYFKGAVDAVLAATGIAVALALIRGLARDSASTLGNFWVDVVRGTLYVLLPISVVFGLIFVWKGAPENFNPYTTATTLEGATQTIAQGPAASQEIIKLLGTNGGGFFNANSAHPFENPTPFTNFLEMLALLAIPAAIVYTFGRIVGDVRQGWAIWAAMAILLIGGIGASLPQEQAGNPAFNSLHVDQQLSAQQAGGNFKGKEVRFGMASSVLFTVVTTDAGGAVNAGLDSLMPPAGLIAMLNMQIGEIAYGGIGSGLYGMLVFVLLTLFIAGLMVGRTPEYLGKKIQSFEMKMVMLAILVYALSILGFSAVASVTDAGVTPLGNSGPHGFTEIVYAYTSTTANNGTAFAGLSANTPFYNITLALAMLIGRYLVAIPALAIAGSMVQKPRVPASLGTLPTDHPIFVALLVGTIVVVGVLT